MRLNNMAKIFDNTPLAEFDRNLFQKYGGAVAGIDEAGRGPLAGPVAVGCCIMPLDNIIPGINDSKKVSEAKRELYYNQIIETAICWQVVTVDAERIDEVNILNATKEAMKKCMTEISVKPSVFAIDAVNIDFSIPVLPIIKGDATSYSIACASILAKVTRDRLMKEYDEMYPEYGFSGHKGYGTAAHIAALKQYGPTPIHRRSFIKNFGF